jgi:hypothetical protein
MTIPEAKLAEQGPTNGSRGKPHTLLIDDDTAVADSVALR